MIAGSRASLVFCLFVVEIFVATLCGCLSFRGLDRPSKGEDEPEMQALSFSLINSCDGDLNDGTEIRESPALSFSGFDDEMSSFEQCGISQKMTGIDGFFAFKAEAKQRVFVRASPSHDEQELGVFFLESCEESGCRKAQNRCGKGVSEYAEFIAAETKQYVVGIDSSLEEPVGLEVVLPNCGNGERELGESCDDGNSEAGDGCDSQCRVELRGEPSEEVEPNDDTLEANVLIGEIEVSSFQVQGSLQGDCDVDRFRVSVPEGYALTAHVVDAEGIPCAEDAPAMHLSLRAASEGGAILGAGELSTTPGQGRCPGIPFGASFATGLGEGDYMLTLGRQDNDKGSSEAPFGYRLLVTVLPSAGISD